MTTMSISVFVLCAGISRRPEVDLRTTTTIESTGTASRRHTRRRICTGYQIAACGDGKVPARRALPDNRTVACSHFYPTAAQRDDNKMRAM